MTPPDDRPDDRPDDGGDGADGGGGTRRPRRAVVRTDPPTGPHDDDRLGHLPDDPPAHQSEPLLAAVADRATVTDAHRAAPAWHEVVGAVGDAATHLGAAPRDARAVGLALVVAPRRGPATLTLGRVGAEAATTATRRDTWLLGRGDTRLRRRAPAGTDGGGGGDGGTDGGGAGAGGGGDGGSGGGGTGRPDLACHAAGGDAVTDVVVAAEAAPLAPDTPGTTTPGDRPDWVGRAEWGGRSGVVVGPWGRPGAVVPDPR